MTCRPLAGDVDHPVHSLFGLVIAAHPLLLVDGERGGTHLVIVERHWIERLDAQLFHHLRVLRVVRAAARDRSAGRREQRHLRALLGRRHSRGEAGHAAAHHDDVVLHRLGDLIIGNGLRRNHERPLRHAVGQLEHRVGRVDRAVHCGRCSLRLVGRAAAGRAAHDARCRCSGRTHRSELQKITTRESLLLSHDVLPPG